MPLGGKTKKEPIERGEQIMLGEMFYLFGKYGDAIAQAYTWKYGRLNIETDMSGTFVGHCGLDYITTIFRFDSVKEAIELFRKEIERLRDG